MATATVASASEPDVQSIYQDLLGIEALAQLLQKAFVNTQDETTGVFGTASIIEQLAQRAQKLTGV
jgi:hypothetical protein